MLEKEDLKQIEIIINTSLDAKFDEKLEPIKLEILEPMKQQLEGLDPIKRQLDSLEFEIKEIRIELSRLNKTEGEDVAVAYKDIETLRKRVDNLEMQLKNMQSAHT